MRSGLRRVPGKALAPRGSSAQPSGCPPRGADRRWKLGRWVPFLLSPPRWPSAHTACPPAGESLDAYSSHSRQQKVPEWSAREDPGSPHSPAPGASESAQQVPSKAAEGGGALAEEGRGRHHLCSSSLGAAGAGAGACPWCAPHRTASHLHTPARSCTHLHTPANSKLSDKLQVSRLACEASLAAPSRFQLHFGDSDRKESTCNAGDLSSIHGSGRPPREGHGRPLQYSHLENPLDREACRATVRGVAKSQTRLSN